MSVPPSALRQLSQTSAPDLRVRFDQDQSPSTEKTKFDGGRLFRSADAATQNKADFQALMNQLKAEGTWQNAPGAVDAALASIAKQADSGEPLTARLVAKALAAGDAHLLKVQDAQARAARQMLDHLASQLATPATADKLLQGLGLPNTPQGFASLPTSLQTALRAELMAAAQRELAQLGLKPDELPHPKDVAKLLGAAAQAAQPKLAAMLEAHAKGQWSDVGASLHKASPGLQAAMDTVHAYASGLLNARLLASSGDVASAAKAFDAHLQGKVAAMDNKALLSVMQQLQSTDGVALRLAIAQAAAQPGNVQAQDLLDGLNAFEGHVLDAFATRVMQGNPPPDGGRDLSPGQLLALGAQGKRDAKASLNEQDDRFLSGQVGATRQVVAPESAKHLAAQGVSAVQLKQAILSAPLTLNFQLTAFDKPRPNDPKALTFIKPDGSVNTDTLKMKNIFELPSNTKGPDYLERRDAIETHHFPELAQREALQGRRAQDRPLYAAVNVGQDPKGGASAYGQAFFVLKDEVKQRALYAPTDTFFAYEWAITDDSANRFMNQLTQRLGASDSPYSPELRQAVKDNPSLLTGLRDKLGLEAFFERGGRGRADKIEDLVMDELNVWRTPSDELKLSDQDLGFLIAEAMSAFITEDVDGATLAHVDRMFQHLSDDQVKALKQQQDDPLRVNTGLANYIEAQVFGGIDLSKDVAEVHFIGSGAQGQLTGLDKDALANAMQVAESIGAKFVYTDSLNIQNGSRISPNSPEGRKIMEAQTGELVRTVRADAPFPTSVSQTNSVAKATAEGGLASFRTQHLGEILDLYTGHEQTFDPEGIHGREHISRVVLYSNILANVFRDQGATVDSHALYTTSALHDAGREGNGPDRWEGDSAKLALDRLGAQGITDQRYLELAKGAIQGSATPLHSLEAVILKSADSLDIIRERGLAGYNTNFLAFMGGDTDIDPGIRIPQDTEFRDALIQEVAQFIEATTFRAPSEGAWLTARQDIDALTLKQAELNGDMSSDEAKKVFSDLETAMNRMKDLRDEVVKEHQAHSRDTASLTVFDGIEAQLLANPDRYPIMARYYDAKR